MGVALLRDLASSPRPTGSDAIAGARDRVTRELRDLGFEVHETPFEYSAFPGKFATPLFGGAALFLVGFAGHWGAASLRYMPVLSMALGTAVLLAAGMWVARHGVLAAPLLRRRGVNLEAVRSRANPPGVWLCAHLDSKSQPVPTLLRIMGVVLTGIGFVATAALAVGAALGAPAHPFVWGTAALVTLAGAVPVVLSVVGSNSPGALDNASGVATVLEAARQLDGANVGVLVTDAEELGLAGARAWSRVTANLGATILNCDGVDDAGDNVVMYSGRSPDALLEQVARASASCATPCRSRRLPLGVLTDSVAFQAEQLASVTFSRGSFGSLARVHSKRDDLAHLHGTGIAQIATLMAATARSLTRGEVR